MQEKASKKGKGKGKAFTYERDVICLPKSFESKDGCIKIPRGLRNREFLARNRLIGKVSLSSSMSEDDIIDDIACLQ